MDISPVDIKLVRQDPDSDDCLRACAYMIFQYYSDPIKKEDVWKKLHSYKKHSGLKGAYFQDLGRLAQKIGYKAQIFHYDWQWWNEETVNAVKKGKKSLLSALKKLKEVKSDWPDKKNVDKEINFVKAGGKFTVAIPSFQTLDFFLQKNIPPILMVQSELFYHRPKKDYSHAILVVGKNSDKYLVKDPLYAVSEIASDELLYSWSKTNGWMMVIMPKEIKSKIQQPKLKF